MSTYGDIAINPITLAAPVDASLAAPANTSANDGVKFPNDGRTWLEVHGQGATVVCTIHTQETVDGLAITNPTVSVASGATKKIGPFKQRVFGIASGADQGKVVVSFDDPTKARCAAYRV